MRLGGGNKEEEMSTEKKQEPHPAGPRSHGENSLVFTLRRMEPLQESKAHSCGILLGSNMVIQLL